MVYCQKALPAERRATTTEKTMNQEKLSAAIDSFLENIRSNPSYYEKNHTERNKRANKYRAISKAELLKMEKDDFLEYIGRLWSMLMWGNKKFVVDTLIADNGFDELKQKLAELLYGDDAVEKRWNTFERSVKGVGPATMSELLTYSDPKEYAILNKTTLLCFNYLDVPNMPKYNYQCTGEKYAEVCKFAKEIAAALEAAGAKDCDLLAVDYFLWDEVLPIATGSRTKAPAPRRGGKSGSESQSLHDEVKEKIVEIGRLLGFESRPEVKVSAGAIVDAVWEAKIGNMGKAIYVFEVQSKGSIDSLILNLKRAMGNAAVQAVVAVADEAQLGKILSESAGVIEKQSLRTWTVDDVLAVYDNLSRAHESINKLQLVPDSF